jgi:hypothetical protein
LSQSKGGGSCSSKEQARRHTADLRTAGQSYAAASVVRAVTDFWQQQFILALLLLIVLFNFLLFCFFELKGKKLGKHPNIERAA